MAIKKKAAKSEFVVVWEFFVKASKRREFERVYGPHGDWAKLFRSGEGYIRTELIRDSKTPRRHLTIDVWTSREAYARFKKENRAKYRVIDERCASLTENEAQIGEFRSCTNQKR